MASIIKELLIGDLNLIRSVSTAEKSNTVATSASDLKSKHRLINFGGMRKGMQLDANEPKISPLCSG